MPVIWQTLPVRRSLGGMLLVVAGVLLALCLSTLWLQRVAFSPQADPDRAAAILDDAVIRTEVATLIASADAPVLGLSSTQLKEFIEQIATIDAGAALMADFIRDAHSRVLGQLEEPVQVTGEEQVVIVRDERVALEQPITLPVQEVTAVSLAHTLSRWTVLIAGGLGILTLIAGFLFRPEQGEASFAAMVGFASLGLLFPFFGWLVPTVVLPATADDTWMGIFPRLAAQSQTITIAVSLLSFAIAGFFAWRALGQRPRRQSSTPLAVGRYREQRRWSV